MFLNILQVGAFRGDDKIHKILKNEITASALLIEPVPWNFNLLKNNYKNIANPDRIIFDSSVINTYNGQCKFYAIKNNNYNTHWIPQISSLNLNFIKDHEQFANNEIIEYEQLYLQCINFCSLIKKYKITNVELLKIDVEGFDYDLIIDWPYNKIKPKYIQFESAHLDGSVNQSDKIIYLHEFLYKRGYFFAKNEHLDKIFIRR